MSCRHEYCEKCSHGPLNSTRPPQWDLNDPWTLFVVLTGRAFKIVLWAGAVAALLALLAGCASVRNPNFSSCRTKPSDCQPVTVVLSNGGTMQVCDSPTLDKDVAQFNENMREASGPTIVEIKK